ncbi:hypothetical protein HK105_203609 [Polyrhizophydium stewartii]|uniref:Uncharacterized protein n=1 Tax=Polyrhizophydium stewartii TaxID=2732419 RepID=A0ABR4NBD5_9FUNG
MRILFEDTSLTVEARPIRSQFEREASPDRLNLNRKNLYVCPPMAHEDQLRLLNFQNNFISRIENLDNLVNLVFLDMFNNQIESIRGLDELVNLRVLMLSRNRIRRIENLDSLVRLDVLDLHSNQIIAIENISKLLALRVLNLEDNLIERVPTLTGVSNLGELNLKRNKIRYFDRNSHLNQLRRLVLSDNRVATFEDVSAVFEIPGLTELAMDQNKVSEAEPYRTSIVSRCKSIKLLDGRRVLEEERRSAAKIAKKDAEKRREMERRTTQVEERKRCIEHIRQIWDEQMAGHSATSQPHMGDGHATSQEKKSATSPQRSPKRSGKNKPLEGKSAYVELEDSTLRIFGNGVGVLDRSEIASITALHIEMVPFAKIEHAIPKLERFALLNTLDLGPVNLCRLKELNQLSGLKRLRHLSISAENPVTQLSMFRLYTVLLFADTLETLCLAIPDL